MNFSYVDSRKNTQSNLTKLIINMLNRISGKSDLLTQVAHLNLVFEGRVRITMVNIHDVDTTSLCSLLQ